VGVEYQDADSGEALTQGTVVDAPTPLPRTVHVRAVALPGYTMGLGAGQREPMLVATDRLAVVRGCGVGIFRFRHVWRVPADLTTTFAALADVDQYPLWWPQVRGIRRIDDDSGHAYVRSMLPYTLDLVLTREVEDPAAGLLRVRLGGDLQGWSEFRLSEADEVPHDEPGHIHADGASAPTTLAHYRQEAAVTAAGLEHFVPIARPLLTLNHTWMMRAGERGLARWLRVGAPGAGS
jgi:hypothetical protein